MSENLLRRGARLDRYEIRELIGKGGMGEVYRGWDPVLHRHVAVKVLSLRDEEMLRRFEREAKAIAKLDNHNVVEIYDFSIEGEHPYIVMECLEGESLRDRLERGQMEVADGVEVVLGVCRGVSACHRVGIIHRDVKAENVFLCETAHYWTVAKVLDFGVAKAAIYAADDLTPSGKIVGSPRYMSPEQIQGREADELSDQYAIGTLLYAVLTRTLPFRQKDQQELAWAILRSEYLRPRQRRPEIPEGLETVNVRAMSADRSARFSSVLALARALIPYAPPERQEMWREQFEENPAADDESMSGEVTEVEVGLFDREDTCTRVVDPEEVAALARESVESSVRAGDAIENEVQSTKGRHQQGRRLLVGVVLAVLALTLGGVLVVLLVPAPRARVGRQVTLDAMTPSTVVQAIPAGAIPDGGDARDGIGADQDKGLAAVHIEGKHEASAAAEEPPKRHRRKKQVRNELDVEYTKDGSPILY